MRSQWRGLGGSGGQSHGAPRGGLVRWFLPLYWTHTVEDTCILPSNVTTILVTEWLRTLYDLLILGKGHITKTYKVNDSLSRLDSSCTNWSFLQRPATVLVCRTDCMKNAHYFVSFQELLIKKTQFLTDLQCLVLMRINDTLFGNLCQGS